MTDLRIDVLFSQRLFFFCNAAVNMCFHSPQWRRVRRGFTE